MKLYATVTSERATKGQGGNDYIEIELKAFDRVHPIGNIILEVTTDGSDENRQYLLTWKDALWDDRMILREGHEKEGLIQTAEAPPTKGKQQKGKKCGNCGREATQSIGDINRCERCSTL